MRAEEPPDALDDRTLGQVFAFWQEKRAARAMPDLADIDGGRLAALSDHLRLIQIEGSPPRFRVAPFPANDGETTPAEGLYLDQIIVDPAMRGAMLSAYVRCWRQAEPVIDTVRYPNPAGGVVSYRRLLLPLTAGGATPAAILAGIAA